MEYIVPEEHNPTLPYAPVGLHSVFGRNEGSLNIPVQETQPEETIPQTTDIHESSPPARHMTFRHAAKVALSATLVLSIPISESLSEEELHTKRGYSLGYATPILEQSALEVIAELPDPNSDIHAYYEATLANSVCDLPGTAEAAANYYQRIFENANLSGLSDEELFSATETVIENLTSARAKLSFLDLPENYNRLLSDVYLQDQDIPLEVYQEALQTMLEPAGVKAVFNWDNDKELYNEAMPKPDEAIPLGKTDELSENNYKQAILGAIQLYGSVPKHVFESRSDQAAIYLGDITLSDGMVIGLAYDSKVGNFVIIDAINHSGFNDARMIAAHETQHIVDFEDNCGNINYDTAWRYQYPKDFQPQLMYFGNDQGFTTIHDSLSIPPDGQEIVLANGYGGLNWFEDRATMIGGYVLDAQNTDQLFLYPGQSASIYRRLGLFLGRVASTDPDYASFLEFRLKAAKIERELIKRQETLRIWDEYDPNNDVDYYSQPTDGKKEAELIEKSVELFEKTQEIQLAQTGVPFYPEMMGGIITN